MKGLSDMQNMKEFLELLQQDREYKQLLYTCRQAEAAYEAMANTLTQEEKAIIEQYLSACEELDHRLLTIALSRQSMSYINRSRCK